MIYIIIFIIIVYLVKQGLDKFFDTIVSFFGIGVFIFLSYFVISFGWKGYIFVLKLIPDRMGINMLKFCAITIVFYAIIKLIHVAYVYKRDKPNIYNMEINKVYNDIYNISNERGMYTINDLKYALNIQWQNYSFHNTQLTQDAYVDKLIELLIKSKDIVKKGNVFDVDGSEVYVSAHPIDTPTHFVNMGTIEMD